MCLCARHVGLIVPGSVTVVSVVAGIMIGIDLSHVFQSWDEIMLTTKRYQVPR